MENRSGRSFSVARWTAEVVLLAVLDCGWCGEDFRIRGIAAGTDGVQVHCDAAADQYYVLYYGPAVTDISAPVDIKLGLSGALVLRHSLPAGERFGCYRVMQVPVAAPLDLDNDGFDDVIELRSPHVHPLVFNADSDGDGLPDTFEEDWGLNPHDPADAFADQDGDGFANIDAFRLVLDPFTPAYVDADRVSVTESFVGEAVPLQGSSTGGEALTLFAPAMLQQAVSAGKVVAVDSGGVQTAHATLAADTDIVACPLYLHFASGETADVLGIADGGTRLLLASDVSGTVAAGEHFVIRPHLTLALMFAPVAKSGQQWAGRGDGKGAVLATAALPLDGTVCTPARLQGGPPLVVSQPAGKAVILPPGHGVGIVRWSADEGMILLHGVVRAEPLIVALRPGTNYVGSVTIPQTVTAEAVGLCKVAGVRVDPRMPIAPSEVIAIALPEDGIIREWHIPAPVKP